MSSLPTWEYFPPFYHRCTCSLYHHQQGPTSALHLNSPINGVVTSLPLTLRSLEHCRLRHIPHIIVQYYCLLGLDLLLLLSSFQQEGLYQMLLRSEAKPPHVSVTELHNKGIT